MIIQIRAIMIVLIMTLSASAQWACAEEKIANPPQTIEKYNPLNILPKTPPKGKWRFGATADMHTQIGHGNFVAIQSVFQSALVKRNIQLFLNLGDVISNPKTAEELDEFVKIWGANRLQIAHFLSPGNHDIYSSPDSFDRFIIASGFPGQTKEKMDYYFDFGNVRFININASASLFKDGEWIWSDPIPQWKITELQNYFDNLFTDAIGKIDHIVIFQHMGLYDPKYCYTYNDKWKIMYDYLGNKYANKNFTIMWLYGHGHRYYRTLRHGMYFMEVGTAYGSLYNYFIGQYNTNPGAMGLVEGDVFGDTERCFIEGEVDGKTIEFRLVAFDNCASDHENPHYPPKYKQPHSTYPEGTILNSIKLTSPSSLIK